MQLSHNEKGETMHDVIMYKLVTAGQWVRSTVIKHTISYKYIIYHNEDI